jgi:hypothetical protein
VELEPAGLQQRRLLLVVARSCCPLPLGLRMRHKVRFSNSLDLDIRLRN